MSQITKFICVIIILLSCSITAQTSISDDPETIQNSIDFRINQAQRDIENNNFFEAEKKLDEALVLANKIDNQKSLGIIYAKIGKLQFITEEPDEAIKTLIKANKIQRLAKDETNLAETYKILGNVYYAKKEYHKALEYYTSSHSLFEQDNLNNFVAEILLNQGKTYIALKDYPKAKKQLQKSILLANRYELNKILSSAKIYFGYSLYQLDEKATGLREANQGLKIATDNKFTVVLNEGYLILSDLYEFNGNYQAANEHLKKHLTLSDSLLEAKRNSLSQDKRVQLLTDGQTEYQKKQLADLEDQKAANDLSKLTTILSIALITILSLLTLSLYKNNNIRLKTNNMLHKKNSELIVSKEKAELASKTKANFLSTVTHELRTPLYAVTGLTNMLLEEDPKPEQIQHLKSLKFSGDYLLTFINDILQINKIEANKVEIEPEPFNLKKKITNVIAALKNSANDNHTKLHFEYEKDLPQNFIADQIKISQILINLIGNAIKFTKNGDIWVKVCQTSQEGDVLNLKFEIIDNGIGISKEKQEQLFESFSQGSIQINRKYGGTGLGLSIVKGLVKILKGKIYLNSELGKGSNFTFEIPLKYTEKEEVVEVKKSYFSNVDEVDLESINILIVEDNKINQMITKKILNKMQLKCDVVDNGEAAVEKVRNQFYDVVLMDIHMPGISGLEATKLIRDFNKDITIFALTAVTLEDKMHEFDEAGFDDIISKPFKQEDFEKKLFNALIVDRKKPV
ncbi:ATP-binding protein [Mangrovimonas yunxiaonensis]|uniref:ATP-binding protein n=1 Tax=Mangrovimonas yunxiaonensis TaxID=1197477 RepID=UPI0005632540|nr:ATP-binding protein [Mangrovimonas yunxiaonensis]GGH34866.1 histidine kinase [Mangrovimonas yunxiaonensis]